MLTEALAVQSQTIKQDLTQSLTQSLTNSLTKKFGEMLDTSVTKAIDDLRIELTEVMAAGFGECATSTEMAEVKANIGSLEQRFAWMQGVMVTKDYLDERMIAYEYSWP